MENLSVLCVPSLEFSLRLWYYLPMRQTREPVQKTKDKSTDLEKMRHTAAHVLAAAILELYPNAKLGIGPVIENGFYYDFDFDQPLSVDDLPKIEQEMHKIVEQKRGMKKSVLPRNEALDIVRRDHQPYKEELIHDLPEGEEISFYDLDGFVDLCAGPHVESSDKVGAFKLTGLAGAYWKGSEKNRMLTRIYGLAFSTQKELDEHLAMLEEAKKRDHRKLGVDLGLFFFHETAPGMPYWLPKGVMLYNTLIQFWREEHQKRGYQEIVSPILNKKELYQTSGHWEHYLDNMFVAETDEKETYAVKAMNCPNAMVVFAMRPRSYKELPLRFGDTDMLHRYERSGTLNGLLRVREFRQDDAHVFVAEDHIKEEFEDILAIAERFYGVFDMDFSLRLGTRPAKFMGDVKTWDKAEAELTAILGKSGRKYTTLAGDGAFYGPKVDIVMKDSLGREWQMGTIQLDFQIPRNFKLSFIDEEGKEQTPVVIHRAIYGSLERFIGILIEHFGGAFPLWLAPEQVVVIPISEKHAEYADLVVESLRKAGIRAQADQRNETLGKRIREHQLQKIPYALIVGDKEQVANTVSVRHQNLDEGTMSLEQLSKRLAEEIKQRS